MTEQLRPRLSGGRRRWSAEPKELRPDVRLCPLQAPPESIAATQRQSACGDAFPSSFATAGSDDGLNERQEGERAHHESGQHMVEQHREGVAAARASKAVRAKEAPAPDDLLLRSFGVAAKKAVPDERSNAAAVWASSELRPAKALVELLVVGDESRRAAQAHGRALGTAAYLAIRPAGKKQDTPGAEGVNTSRSSDPNCDCARSGPAQSQFGKNRLDVVTSRRGSTPEHPGGRATRPTPVVAPRHRVR